MRPEGRRVVGVLGGMGPMATVEAYQRIVLATPATTDQEHLHVIIDSDPSIPDRTGALLFGEPDPRPRLEASANRLATAGAEIICMPCNTAHAFHPWLQERVPVPIVHMLEETGAAAAATGSTTFGLLATAGTVRTRLYQDVFEHLGLTMLAPSVSAQGLLSSTIASIKAGHLMRDAVLDQVQVAARELSDEGVETLVIGCTELSLIASHLAASYAVIDALDVLVRTTVAAALDGDVMPEPCGNPGGTTDVA